MIAWAKNIVVNVPIVIGSTSTEPTTIDNHDTSQLASLLFNTSFLPDTNTYEHTNTRQLAINPEFGSSATSAVTNPSLSCATNPYHPQNSEFMPEQSGASFQPYRPPATNPEFMSGPQAFPPSVTNPDPPVNTEDASQHVQTRDSQFVPLSDLATNYSIEQPPSYDSIMFNT